MLFNKHQDFLARTEQPFNGGPPLDQLCQSYITPNDFFFVRNHGTVPTIDPDTYRLNVEGLVQQPLSLSLDELRSTFRSVTTTATLQCAGNRRSDLIAYAPVPGEVPWGSEAVSNGVWTGVPLRDVLEMAGIAENARHVALVGLDEVEREGRRFGFGGSIPLEKALAPDVILAYALNNEPLPQTHGFPLRLVVPGYIGARSVKWLERIVLQAEPSENYFQAHAYKLFPPHIRPETADWENGEMLGSLNINAVICSPGEGATVEAGPLSVRGYAITGEKRRIERVEVSGDGGVNWTTARLLAEPQPSVWSLWETTIDVAAGRQQLVVRAFDDGGNVQPEEVGTVWNFKGYMNNAWHRVEITVGR